MKLDPCAIPGAESPKVAISFAQHSRCIMRSNEGIRYLSQFPDLWAWMNRCRTCHHLGYKPELPNQLERGIAAPQFLRKYLSPLSLNSEGLCDQCSQSERTEFERHH
jgi:hypothetical protein